MISRRWEPSEGKYTEQQLQRCYEVTGECHCIDAYKDRGLAQEDCAFCNHGEDVLELIVQQDALRLRVERLEDAIREIADLASWHMDEDAEETNETPEDAVAHVNGLVWQKCMRLLAEQPQKEEEP